MTIIFFLSVLIGIVLAEAGVRTLNSSWLRSQLRNNRSYIQAFQDANDDESRQAAILRTGSAILRFSLTVLGILVAMIAVVSSAPWLLHWTNWEKTVYLASASITAGCWWIWRHRLSHTESESAYGALERWLHWLALEPTVVRRLAFDLERHFALPKRPSVKSPQHTETDPADGAVYVCGLARSGTTILLRVLDDIEVFRSLTYRDMPFVLAPNLWKRITQFAPQHVTPTERAHGDGIHVGYDSPEGFEEVFWRTFLAKKSNARCLRAEEPSAEVLSAFADYRAVVANPRTGREPSKGIPKRYLSKNNNNLLRLHSLCADTTATVLLIYRDPIATARSLHRQHLRFCAAQTQDPFTRTYMGWLAHHEFGVDHLPFEFAAPSMDVTLSPNDQNYWLDYWNAVYSHVLTQKDLNLHLIDHTALCADATGMLERLFTVLGVQAQAEVLARQISPPLADGKTVDGFRDDLLRRAEVIHLALLESPRNIRATESGAKK